MKGIDLSGVEAALNAMLAAKAEEASARARLNDALAGAHAEGATWRRLARLHFMQTEGHPPREDELKRVAKVLARRVQRSSARRLIHSGLGSSAASADAPCLSNTNSNTEHDMRLMKRVTTTEELFEVTEDALGDVGAPAPATTEAQQEPAPTESGEGDLDDDEESLRDLRCPPALKARR